MDAQEFLSALKNEVGLDLALDADGIVDLSVSGRQVTVHHVEASADWTYSTIVRAGTATEPISEATLRRALELSLMGAGTNRHALGLYGEALILSGHADGHVVTPEGFFEMLLLLARTAESLESELRDGAASAPADTEPMSVPLGAFIRV